MQAPIVYVHGFIGHLDFVELREGLDASRVISPALLGYGEHAARMAYGLADQVSHLAQVISATFGTEPVVLVGHSGGAAICVEFAAKHPDQVAALVSAEGNLSPSDAFLSSRLAPMTPDRVQAWLDHARSDPSGFCARERMSLSGQALERLREWLHHQSAPIIHTMARSLLIETVHPRYASVVVQVMTRVPTYLIEGPCPR
jgi:Predicted hydrolases or acyltransferases (alpha/beta hydrolase superfamily)